MMLYKIMLVLTIFGAVNGMIDGMGIYSVHTPQSGHVGIGQAEVTDLSNTVGNAPINPFTGSMLLMTLIHVLTSAALALLTIIPFLTAWGVPLPLAICIQTPVWLVMAWGIWQMQTGHASTMQD